MIMMMDDADADDDDVDDDDDDDDDDSCCGDDDHLSGSLLRCAQQRPLGVPMGLQGSPRSPPEMCSETLNEMLYLVCEMLRLLRQ